MKRIMWLVAAMTGILGAEARDSLRVPDALWAQVKENTGFIEKDLGYTAEEMDRFPDDPHKLRIVERLFADVTEVPRVSGRVTGFLLENTGDISSPVRMGFSLLGISAGAGIKAPGTESWGVEWIEDGVGIDEAFTTLSGYCKDNGIRTPITPRDRDSWNSLPGHVRKLVMRLIIADMVARPYLEQAYDHEFLASALGKEPGIENLYRLCSAPWQDYEEVVPRESFQALDRIDMSYLGFAATLYTRHVQGAIEEFRQSVDSFEFDRSELSRMELMTPSGKVLITGEGDDRIEGGYILVVDLGGNDQYSGTIASPSRLAGISTIFDLEGDDFYDANTASLACGNHGIGLVVDLQGDDRYHCTESGIGCAWYGVGMAADFAGDDSYVTRGAWGQGAAHAGVGALLDLEGDDAYECATRSQGFGSTLGVGLLVDSTGNDSYLAYPDGNPSAPFHNNSVSFAQGTGFGRRADYGDGHSLAGGTGVLVDGSGDDSYSGGVYCQGAGYWWALGVCEDRAGNDTYSNVWYSLGSAPHFAIGCCVDLEGNDRYNTMDGATNDSLVSQTQGCARDGSVAWFIDGDGDDKYFHRNRCAGSGDLNSIAVFWDRRGNDSYICDRKPPYQNDRSCGGSVVYPEFGSFRDEMASVGVFLDTGGEDSYIELMPDDEDKQGPGLEVGNDTKWHHTDERSFKGFGMDTDFPGD